jgi:hypothetical protein
MTVEALLLAATTLIALVAAVVAVVAVRSVRELKQSLASVQEQASLHSAQTGPTHAEVSAWGDGTNAEIFVPVPVARPVELEPRVVQGRIIVPPTQSQVVRTALGRPGVRLSVFVHGLARALRPENRDRIVSLMRREYRHRRSERLRAGRQAIRMARPTSAPSTARLGAPPAATLDSRSGGDEHLGEPKPLSLTDRMIGS